MTVTADSYIISDSNSGSGSGGKETAGRVVRGTGPVVDVEFPRGAVPELFNALHADIALAAMAKTLTLEVAQHLGDNLVRCVSMRALHKRAVTSTYVLKWIRWSYSIPAPTR